MPKDQNLLTDSGVLASSFCYIYVRMGRIRYTRVRKDEGAQPIEGDI